eukprot:5344543-Pleurochrysis_carterae.AAC.2
MVRARARTTSGHSKIAITQKPTRYPGRLSAYPPVHAPPCLCAIARDRRIAAYSPPGVWGDHGFVSAFHAGSELGYCSQYFICVWNFEHLLEPRAASVLHHLYFMPQQMFAFESWKATTARRARGYFGSDCSGCPQAFRFMSSASANEDSREHNDDYVR